jgi:hypothetical protein
VPNLPPTAPTARGIFDRLDVKWEVLCADTSVQAAVTDWLVTDHLADDVAAVTDTWVRGLGPAQLLAALQPHNGAVTDALTDAVLRALLLCCSSWARCSVRSLTCRCRPKMSLSK